MKKRKFWIAYNKHTDEIIYGSTDKKKIRTFIRENQEKLILKWVFI